MAVSDADLLSKGGDEVRARFGQPTIVSKTDRGNLLWVYKPSWKLLPDDSGTLYVEFKEGKVIDIFRKK